MSFVTRDSGLGVYPVSRETLAEEMQERDIGWAKKPELYLQPGSPGWKNMLSKLHREIAEIRMAINQLRRGELSPGVLPDWQLPRDLVSVLYHYQKSYLGTELWDAVELHEKEREVNLTDAIEYYIQTYEVAGGDPASAPPDAGPPPAVAPAPAPPPDVVDVDATPVSENLTELQLIAEFYRTHGGDGSLLLAPAPAPAPTSAPPLYAQEGANGDGLTQPAPEFVTESEDYAEDVVGSKGKKALNTLVWVGGIAGGISAIVGLWALVRSRRKR